MGTHIFSPPTDPVKVASHPCFQVKNWVGNRKEMECPGWSAAERHEKPHRHMMGEHGGRVGRAWGGVGRGQRACGESLGVCGENMEDTWGGMEGAWGEDSIGVIDTAHEFSKGRVNKVPGALTFNSKECFGRFQRRQNLKLKS